MDNLPEHDKLRAVSDKSQVIGDFIVWLGFHGVVLARWGEYDLEPINRSVDTWLAMYFGIDLKKLEAEKRALLDEVRKLNER